MILRHNYQSAKLLEELGVLAARDYGLIGRFSLSLRNRDCLTIGDYKIYMRGSLYEVKQKGYPAVTRVTPDETLRFVVKSVTPTPPLLEIK